MALLTNKLYQTIAVFAIIIGLIYLSMIKPRIDLENEREKTAEQEVQIRAITHDSKVKVFETKYEVLNGEIKPKEGTHEDPNLSVGVHTIIFD